MPHYRKKPLAVEAWQLTTENVASGALDHFDPSEVEIEIQTTGFWRARMTTIHGDKAWAAEGDWIVAEEVPGRFYPVRADIFAATYEPLAATQQDAEALRGEVRRILATMLGERRTVYIGDKCYKHEVSVQAHRYEEWLTRRVDEIIALAHVRTLSAQSTQPDTLSILFACPMCGALNEPTQGVIVMEHPYRCDECMTTLVFSVRSPELDAMHDEVLSEDGPQW